jgi:hypothetical protein
MRHPTDGTLRRLVDEPAGVADADRKHVAGCPACLSGLAAAKADAAATGAALDAGAGGEVAIDVDAGWQRLSRAVAADRPGRRPARPTGRWRAALRSPVIAAAGAVALLTGASAAAAADWLEVFRTEKVAPVTITQADLVALPDVSAYGEIEVASEPNVRGVADAEAAERVTGLSVPRVDEFPRGVTGVPTYQVGDRMSVTFTFSVDKAARTAAAAGREPPPPPPGLDGSRFRLEAGPGVAAVWSKAGGVPTMVVGRVVAPKAYASGIPFAAARDYVLSLPGLPADVAAQLREFSGDGTTLPLPVRAERLTSSAVEVAGAPATLLTARDRLVAAVVWVRGGVVTVVAGSLTADEVLSVARGLR